MQMKHAGILAHSIEGAALSLLEFCQNGFRELGPHSHPDVTLDCIALGRSMKAWDQGDYNSIRETLAESVSRLAQAGADFFFCPDNTAHIALEVEGEDLLIPGLHIAEVVSERAAADGRRRIGILGTKNTMESSLYPRALTARALQYEVPSPADRRILNDVIFEELVNGIFSDASRREYIRVIEWLQDRGCDAVALVCTEIPLLVTPSDSPLPTLDSTRLLARAAFDVAVGQRQMPSWRGGHMGNYEASFSRSVMT